MMLIGGVSGASDAAMKDGWERSILFRSLEVSGINFLDLADRLACFRLAPQSFEGLYWTL